MSWNRFRSSSSWTFSAISNFSRAAQYEPLNGDGSEDCAEYVPLNDRHDVRGQNADLGVEDVPKRQQSNRHRIELWTAIRYILVHLQFLVPSFLDQRTTRPGRGALRPTAWLDGLRGFASLFVVFHHFSVATFSWDIHKGWAPNGDQTAWLLRLPIIRLLIAGPPQVAVFFVVSGYAISHKPIKLAREGRFADVGATLCSSIFRRHPRLFLPAAIVTLCSALMVQLDANSFPSEGIPGASQPTRVPPRMESLVGQLRHFKDVEISTTVPIYPQTGYFTPGNPYDPNLWTLPFEYTSSFAVFLFIAAFTRVHDKLRMAVAMGICIYIQCFAFFAIFPFFCGMLICDLHFEIDKIRSVSARQDSVIPTVSSSTRMRHLRRIIAILAFIFALWLIGCVDDGWSYITIASWEAENNKDRLWVPLGAACLVFTVDQAPFLQILFTNAFAQYLGRISYSLYLVHGPLLWSLGVKLAFFGLRASGWHENHAIDADTDNVDENAGSPTYGARWMFGILLAACLWWPIVIYAADLTARYVDEKCVLLTKWAYRTACKMESRITRQ